MFGSNEIAEKYVADAFEHPVLRVTVRPFTRDPYHPGLKIESAAGFVTGRELEESPPENGFRFPCLEIEPFYETSIEIPKRELKTVSRIADQITTFNFATHKLKIRNPAFDEDVIYPWLVKTADSEIGGVITLNRGSLIRSFLRTMDEYSLANSYASAIHTLSRIALANIW